MHTQLAKLLRDLSKIEQIEQYELVMFINVL